MPSASCFSKMMSSGALPIGLGCSRLGSVNGSSGEEARALLRVALDMKIGFFDTSNIYGQGDSERILGEVLGNRQDCVVCSKAGKHLSWKTRALVPLKGVFRSMARRSKYTQRGVASARAKPMPTCWDPDYLTQSLEGSLRRLRRERIEIFMLHSPPFDVVSRGDAVGALETAYKAGKIGLIGVSVDDVACAEAALRDHRVQAIQMPMPPGETEFEGVLEQAAQAGVAVIAREILGGATAIAQASDPATYAAERIEKMVRDPRVTLTLIGATRISNLQASVDAVRRIAD